MHAWWEPAGCGLRSTSITSASCRGKPLLPLLRLNFALSGLGSRGDTGAAEQRTGPAALGTKQTPVVAGLAPRLWATSTGQGQNAGERRDRVWPSTSARCSGDRSNPARAPRPSRTAR